MDRDAAVTRHWTARCSHRHTHALSVNGQQPFCRRESRESPLRREFCIAINEHNRRRHRAMTSSRSFYVDALMTHHQQQQQQQQQDGDDDEEERDERRRVEAMSQLTQSLLSLGPPPPPPPVLRLHQPSYITHGAAASARLSDAAWCTTRLMCLALPSCLCPFCLPPPLLPDHPAATSAQPRDHPDTASGTLEPAEASRRAGWQPWLHETPAAGSQQQQRLQSSSPRKTEPSAHRRHRHHHQLTLAGLYIAPLIALDSSRAWGLIPLRPTRILDHGQYIHLYSPFG